MADSAKADLEEAMPALAAALTALKALDKNDIVEIKSFSKPPPMVQMTMEAVCILKGEKPDWDAAKVRGGVAWQAWRVAGGRAVPDAVGWVGALCWVSPTGCQQCWGAVKVGRRLGVGWWVWWGLGVGVGYVMLCCCCDCGLGWGACARMKRAGLRRVPAAAAVATVPAAAGVAIRTSRPGLHVLCLTQPPPGPLPPGPTPTPHRPPPPQPPPQPRPRPRQHDMARQRLLGDSNFMRSLEEFDKDNIPDAYIKKLQRYVENPDYTPDLVARVSKAARSLCMWTHAMNTYHRVAKASAGG